MNLVEIKSNKIKRGLSFIRINKKGVINISSELTRRLNIKIGTCIKFFQDADSPKDWYLCLDKEGLIARSANDQKTAIMINSASIASRILESLNLTENSVFMVATEPVQGKYYAIITSSAKPTNRK